MKHIISPLFLFIAATFALVHGQAPLPSGTTGPGNCANKGNPPPGPGCQSGCDGDSEPTSGSESCTSSEVNNLTFGYTTESEDYVPPSSPSACESCGDAAAGGRSRLPELRLVRYHTPSLYSALCSSFGANSGLREYCRSNQFVSNH